MGITKLLSVAISLVTPILVNAQAPTFTQVIVFGDSLSDDGNIAHATWLASVIRAVSSTTAIIGLPTTLTRRPRQICMWVPGTNNWKKRFYRSRRTALVEPIMHLAALPPKMAHRTYPAINRQLSALGSQSSIGFP